MEEERVLFNGMPYEAFPNPHSLWHVADTADGWVSETNAKCFFYHHCDIRMENDIETPVKNMCSSDRHTK